MPAPQNAISPKGRIIDRLLLVGAAVAVLIGLGTVAAYAGMDDKNLTWFTRPAFALIAVVVFAREWHRHRTTWKTLHDPSLQRGDSVDKGV